MERHARDRELKAGEIIWQYEIERLLGKGAFGDVYLAHHVQMRRRFVALKRLRMSAASEPIIQRFRNEAFAMGELYHPNVLLIFELIEPDKYPNVDSYYIVMEYLDGGTLRDWLEHNDPAEVEVGENFRIVKDILRGLAVAHQEKIYHRDIKPENILLSSDGSMVKIGDWGLAHLEDFRMTHLGDIIGTLAYMAPEQASGKSAKVDGRADLYSVGVMLYEMVTGNMCLDFNSIGRKALQKLKDQKPDDYNSPQMQYITKQNAYLRAIANDKRIDPITFVPDLLPPFRELLQKSVEVDPAQRFQTAEEFANNLDRVLKLQLTGTIRAPGRTTSYDERFSKVASLLNEARLHRQERAFSKAVGLLQEACRLITGDAGVCLELARIYNLMERKEDAIKILEEAVRQNPENHVLLRSLGMTYMSRDRVKALEFLKKSLKLNPNQPQVEALIHRLSD